MGSTGRSRKKKAVTACKRGSGEAKREKLGKRGGKVSGGGVGHSQKDSNETNVVSHSFKKGAYGWKGSVEVSREIVAQKSKLSRQDVSKEEKK